MPDRELLRYVREAFRHMDSETQHISFEEMGELATGQVSESRAAWAQSHLAGCQLCRERMQQFEQFVKDCEHPTSVDVSGEWRELKRKLRPSGKKVVVIWRWLPAAAAAVIVMAGLSWLGVRMLREFGSPQHLLAEAYHERRSSEFRLAGAAYAPVQSISKGVGSAFERPAKLTEARDRLTADLEKNPTDPDLLRLYGEWAMMDADPSIAIEALRQASDLHVNDPRIQADLGAAYALRAQVKEGSGDTSMGDYIDGLEYLSRSLRLQPGNQEVLFNRALVLEEMRLYDQAVAEWQEYLKLDPESRWAEEARTHLGKDQEKVKSRTATLSQSSNTAVESPTPAEIRSAQDLEAYLSGPLVSQWLPRFNSDENARQAVNALAETLEDRGDLWLYDLVRSGIGSQVVAGYKELNDADRENNQGKVDVALRMARDASVIFEHAHNPAAVLRARYSEVAFLHNSGAIAECVTAAERLDAELEKHRYVRLQAKNGIERAICYMNAGRLGEADHVLEQVSTTAAKAGFGATAMRARIVDLSVKDQVGLQREISAAAQKCLQEFWDGTYRPESLYSIVSQMRDIENRAGRQETAWFLARSAVWAATAEPVHLQEGPARAQLAIAAEVVGEQAEAQENLIISDRLLAGLPPAYRLEAQTSFAHAELNRGKNDDALDRLKKLEPIVPSQPSSSAVNYYSVLGEALRRKGLLPEAEDAFHQSIALGRQRLASRANERESAGVLKTLEESYRGLVAATLSLHPGNQGDEEEALRIWRQYRTFDSMTDTESIPHPNGIMLSYAELPGGEGFAAWLIRDQQVVFRRLPVSKSEAAAVITRFLQLCSDKNSPREDMSRTSQQLYKWLIGPFERQLMLTSSFSLPVFNGDHQPSLVVELDGTLSGIPMQALMDPGGNFLGSRFFVHESSGFRSNSPGPEAIGSHPRAFVLERPELGANAGRRLGLDPRELPDEVPAVKRLVDEPEVRQGYDATVQALRDALPRSEIVHINTHGYTSDREGALLFASKDTAAKDDQSQGYDLLQAADVARQDWSQVRLVVLSACATASGETRGPHNPDSMVRALTRAGVSNVVASLWNVDAEATSNLMGKFYGSLKEGQSPSQALGTAQQWMQHNPEHPEWAQPYFWAAFQLYAAN